MQLGTAIREKLDCFMPLPPLFSIELVKKDGSHGWCVLPGKTEKLEAK